MWFAEVKSEFKGTTAKKIAADFGISEPMLSHYLKISRFPDEVRSRLKDVRRVSVAVARQVVEAIDADGNAGLAKVLAALDGAPEEIDADTQVNLIIRATTKAERKASAPKPRSEHFVVGGRRCATLARSGKTSLIRFSTEVPHERVRELLVKFVEEENAKRGEQTL